jgi:hypothetical protein
MAEKKPLLPFALLLRNDLIMETGQAMPKQISMPASKTLPPNLALQSIYLFKQQY